MTTTSLTDNAVADQGSLYALLIAIDKYDAPGNNLKGCVRDSGAMESYLREFADADGRQLMLHRLRSPLGGSDEAAETDAPPTRSNIIAGFADFLTQAGPTDTVCIHFAGHGYQQPRPAALEHLESNSASSEVLVCQDSFTWVDGRSVLPLFDLEIRWLLEKIARRRPHIVVLTDCCNSSGNTRDIHPDVDVRSARSVSGVAGPDVRDFVFYQRDEEARRLIEEDSTRFRIPQGRHVALAACHNYELAKEAFVEPGKKSGVFTWFTLQALRATRGRVSYRDLIKIVRARTMARVAHQAPQFFSPQPEDADQAFFGGDLASRSASFMVRPGTGNGEGVLDAGLLHGIRPVEEGATQLALYPPQVDIASARRDDGLPATVIAVTANESTVRLRDDTGFAPGVAFYRAHVTASPLPPARFELVRERDGERVERGVDEVLDRGASLVTAAAADSPFVTRDESGVTRDFSVFVYRHDGEHRMRIAELDRIDALIEPLVGLTEGNARRLMGDLAHIARWRQTRHLHNSFCKLIDPAALSLIVIDGDGNETEPVDGRVSLTAADALADAPRLKFKVQLNLPDHVPLYCALVYLKSDFSIDTDMLAPETHLGRVAYSEHGRDIVRKQLEAYAGAHIRQAGRTEPKGLYRRYTLPNGKDEIEDHYLLIASTTQFDPASLRLAALGRATSTRDAEPPTRPRTQLEALMQTVATRSSDLVTDDAGDADAPLSDWWTTSITVRLTRDDRQSQAASSDDRLDSRR